MDSVSISYLTILRIAHKLDTMSSPRVKSANACQHLFTTVLVNMKNKPDVSSIAAVTFNFLFREHPLATKADICDLIY